MTVRDVMSARVITIPADATVADAREALSANRIQHLIVIDGKRVVGSLWDRDLTNANDDAPVTRFMSRRVATVSPVTTIRAVAGKLIGRDAGAVVVVDDNRLIGIVTASDLVRALAKGATHLAPQPDRMVMRSRGPRHKHASR